MGGNRSIFESLERRICLAAAPLTNAATVPETPQSPIPIGPADFNGDGKDDIAYFDPATGLVLTLIGDGAGGFAAAPVQPTHLPLTVTAEDHRPELTPIDVTGDGKLDLLVMTGDYNGSQNLTLFIGNGDGTFMVPSAPPMALPQFDVSIVRVNGKTAVIVPDSAHRKIEILVSASDGSLSPAAGSPLSVNFDFAGAPHADVNGDGKDDLVLVNVHADGSETLHFAYGNGHGGFTVAATAPLNLTPPPSHQSVYASTIGDWNGDGREDVAAASAAYSYTFGIGPDLHTFYTAEDVIQLYLSNGDGTFTAHGSPAGIGNVTYVLDSTRFNGKSALIMKGQGGVFVLLANADGTLAPPLTVPDPLKRLVGQTFTGDFNGDGKHDLAGIDFADSRLNVFFGKGDGTFTPAATAGTIPLKPFLPQGTLDAAVSTTLPATIVDDGSAKGIATVTITAPSTDAIRGPVHIALYTSTLPILYETNQLRHTIRRKVNLPPGGTATFSVRIHPFPGRTYYSRLGTYHLLATVTAPDGTLTAATGPTLTLVNGMVSLAATSMTASPTTVTPGERLTVTLTLQNTGNTTAAGTPELVFSLSSHPNISEGGAIARVRVHMKLMAQESKTFRVRFRVPPETPERGSYYLAMFTSARDLGFADPDNPTLVATVPIEVA